MEQHIKSIKLHDNVIDVLFKHRKEISSKLSDIHGLFYIDHISITILNSNNELLIFSSTPSVEFNLIINGLWQYDQSFLPMTLEPKILFWWEKAYRKSYRSIIKQIKEINHHYSLGFSIANKIDELYLVYSYATRSRNINLKSYYLKHNHQLLAIGDYAFKLIYDIYKMYDQKNTIKPYLTLIIDNDK